MTLPPTIVSTDLIFPAVPDRQRLLDRKILVDGQDLAIEEDRVGGFGEAKARWRGEVQHRENRKCFAEAQHVVAPVFSFVPKPSLRGALATKQSILVLLRHGLLRWRSQ